MTNKFIYYTFIIFSLTTIIDSKYLELETINKIIEKSEKFLPYLSDPTEKETLSLLEKDFANILSKEPESKNLEDILFELFNFDLDNIDDFEHLTMEQLIKQLKKEINEEIENRRLELLRLDYKNCLENLKNIYIKYLLSFMNNNIKNGFYKIDIEFSPINQLQNYFLGFVEDKDFMKDDNEKLKNNKLRENARTKALKVFLEKNGEFNNDLKEAADDIANERRLRQYFAKVKNESYYDFNLKIEALLYRATRNIDFNLKDFNLYLERIKSLSNFYYRSIKDFVNEIDEKLIFNLSFEKLYVNENNKNDGSEDDNNLNEIYGNIISTIIQQAHISIPEKSQHMMNEILDTEVSLYQNQIMTRFLLSIYDKLGQDIWNQWSNYEDNKKNNYSLMMAEILIYANKNKINLAGINEFVKNFADLAFMPVDLIKQNVFFKLFTLDLCPLNTDFEFNYKLYKAILDIRVQTFSDIDETNWSNIFDQYLDGRFYYETTEGKDLEFLRYYPNMKILNLNEMEDKDLEDDEQLTSTIVNLNETIIKSLKENKENQCLPMKNTIIDLVKTFRNHEDYLNYVNSVPYLSNITINVEKFKQMVKRNFDYDIDTESGNKISSDIPDGLQNVIEVIAGGNLTRKETDILKRGDILDFFRNKQTRDGNLIYQNNNGSNTKFIYIQMVPTNTDCHKAIKDKLNALSNKQKVI